MTLVLEAHNGVPIDVEVLEEVRSGKRYRREVLLRRSDDRVVAQYAMLSVDLGTLPDDTAEELLSAREPFGRVLTRRMRSSCIERRQIYRTGIGETLAPLVEVEPGTRTYARLVALVAEGVEVGEAFEVIMPGQARVR
jgi:chorismate-pyruvate lyase